MAKRILESHNSMVWEYLAVLRRITGKLNTIPDEDERRQNVALCVLMAVTVVETFLNVFFRLKVKEANFVKHAASILKDLEKRKGLDYKLKHWPKKVLGNAIDLTTGVGKRFVDLKTTRNELMHFNIPNTSVKVQHVELHNFSENTLYNNLKESDASDAIGTAQDFIQAVLESSGLSGPNLASKMLYWTGRPPA